MSNQYSFAIVPMMMNLSITAGFLWFRRCKEIKSWISETHAYLPEFFPCMRENTNASCSSKTMSALHIILFAVTFTRNILIRSCCVFACVEKTSRWRLTCPKASSSILKSRATRGGFTRNQHTERSSPWNYYIFHRSCFWMAIEKKINYFYFILFYQTLNIGAILCFRLSL